MFTKNDIEKVYQAALSGKRHFSIELKESGMKNRVCDFLVRPYGKDKCCLFSANLYNAKRDSFLAEDYTLWGIVSDRILYIIGYIGLGVECPDYARMFSNSLKEEQERVNQVLLRNYFATLKPCPAEDLEDSDVQNIEAFVREALFNGAVNLDILSFFDYHYSLSEEMYKKVLLGIENLENVFYSNMRDATERFSYRERKREFLLAQKMLEDDSFMEDWEYSLADALFAAISRNAKFVVVTFNTESGRQDFRISPKAVLNNLIKKEYQYTGYDDYHWSHFPNSAVWNLYDISRHQTSCLNIYSVSYGNRTLYCRPDVGCSPRKE